MCWHRKVFHISKCSVFIWSNTGVLHVAAFQYSLRNFSEAAHATIYSMPHCLRYLVVKVFPTQNSPVSWPTLYLRRLTRQQQLPLTLNRGHMWNKNIGNNFEIISVFSFTCNHRQWLHVKQNTEIIIISHVTMSETEIKLFQPLKLFQNYFSENEHIGKYLWAAISFRNKCLSNAMHDIGQI